MTDALAALLLVLGSAIALVAAIGVARLPDAFLRMHAATKAGVVGTGLILLGAGFAFGSAEAWMRVVLILAFVLVTTPVASHALGRAAYVGGAPMWAGTIADQLQGVLARRVFDIDPARVPRAARQPITTGEGAAMSVLTFGNTAAQPAPSVGPVIPRRILVAIAGGPEAAPRLAAALRALRANAAEVTLLSLVCLPSIERTGPVPIGGLHWAKRLAAHRLAAARASAAALAQEMEEECRALGLRHRLRHEEGDAAALLALAAAHHDLTVMAEGAWFDHGHALAPEAAARQQRRLSLGAQLRLGGILPGPRRVVVLQDGSVEAAAAFGRFLTLGVAAEAPLHIVTLDLPGAAAARDEALAMAVAHGREAVAADALLHPDHPPVLPGGAPDLLVLHPARDERGARRALREQAAAVLLA